jgi:hypothetical protein
MKRLSWKVTVLLCVWIVAGGLAATLAAEEEEEKLGWYNSGELGLALTTGNSNFANANLGYKLKKKWKNAAFNFQTGMVRNSNDDDRFAECVVSPCDPNNPADFIVRRPSLALDDEILWLRGNYNRKITEKFFWNAGAGWERNTNAGIDSRTNVFGGVGNVWYDGEKTKFSTDYGLSYVDQQDEIDDPTTDDTYPAARFSSDYTQSFGESTRYDNDFIVFGNLSDLDDFNFSMVNGLTVDMTGYLAIKIGLTFLYDNVPSLEEIDLFDPNSPTPGIPVGTITTPNEELDTIFTVSLVVNFGPKATK